MIAQLAHIMRRRRTTGGEGGEGGEGDGDGEGEVELEDEDGVRVVLDDRCEVSTLILAADVQLHQSKQKSNSLNPRLCKKIRGICMHFALQDIAVYHTTTIFRFHEAHEDSTGNALSYVNEIKTGMKIPPCSCLERMPRI